MAGAFGAINGSPESLWYNPAGLSGLDGAVASLSHQSLDAGFDSDYLVASALLGWDQSLGLLYWHEGNSDTYRDALGNAGGRFEDGSSVLGLGYSYDLGPFSLGAAAKMLSEKIEKLSGSGLAYDIGIEGKQTDERALWGLSLQNLGSAPKLGDPGEGVVPPLLLRVGTGLHFGEEAQALLLTGDYRYLFVSQRSAFALGAEYSEVYEDNSLALRAGYDFGANELGGLAGLNVGAGFGFSIFTIDYSYSPLDALGGSHRISLSVIYDQRKKVQEADMAAYLHLSASAETAPTPTPTPRPIKALNDRRVAPELEALLAATPTLTPTPVVQERPKEAPKGILGALFNFFSFGKKETPVPTENGEPQPQPKKGGILRNFFNFFGVSSTEDQVAPDQPAAKSGEEDKFSSEVTPQATPVATTVVTPTAKGTPLMDQFKHWIGK
jgi:hypothetical protein